VTSTTLAVVVGASLATAALVMTATALVARRVGRVSVVDVAWGLLFVAIGWVALALGDGSARSLLLALLVTVWGGRLAWHIRRRALGAGEDPRYDKLLAGAPEGRRFGYAVRKVFVVQGLAAWFVALPVQVAAATDRPLGWVAAAGLLVWAVGMVFEVVGDAQLAAFKRDPANRGRVMDRGLWAWTRHPNYFGDAAVWWGLWLVAAEAWPGVLTVLSPAVMTYFLAFATGARLLESEMAKRPGYPEYMERTSVFLPRPPRRPD
jgi:steroid 5-alpha reductase family enzyme